MDSIRINESKFVEPNFSATAEEDARKFLVEGVKERYFVDGALCRPPVAEVEDLLVVDHGRPSTCRETGSGSQCSVVVVRRGSETGSTGNVSRKVA